MSSGVTTRPERSNWTSHIRRPVPRAGSRHRAIWWPMATGCTYPTGRGVPAVFERSRGKFLSLNLQPNTSLGGADVVGSGEWFFNSGAVFDARARPYRTHRTRRRHCIPTTSFFPGVNPALWYWIGIKWSSSGPAMDHKGTPSRPVPWLNRCGRWTCPKVRSYVPNGTAGHGETGRQADGFQPTGSVAADSRSACRFDCHSNSAVVGGQGCVMAVDLATRTVIWKGDVAGERASLMRSAVREYGSGADFTASARIR